MCCDADTQPTNGQVEDNWNLTVYNNFYRYQEGEVHFKCALAAAVECDDKEIQIMCKVQIGICRGNTTLAHTVVESPSIFDTGNHE